MKNTCKRCERFGQNEEEIRASLKGYIDSLGQEMKVDQTFYNKRLALCDACKYLVGGMCSFCGCFVIVRAVKKKMHCPYPHGTKW